MNTPSTTPQQASFRPVYITNLEEIEEDEYPYPSPEEIEEDEYPYSSPEEIEQLKFFLHPDLIPHKPTKPIPIPRARTPDIQSYSSGSLSSSSSPDTY